DELREHGLAAGGRLFQRVGQVHAQPLPAGEVVVEAAQLQPQLHVRHRVGSHQQLKAEDAPQQMVAGVAVPRPALPGEVRLVNVLNNEVQKRAGAGGRVQHKGVVVGKAIGAVKARPQDMVYAADDVADDGFWRVVDS